MQSLREKIAKEWEAINASYYRELISFSPAPNFRLYERADALRALSLEAETENLSDAELLARYLAI